MIFAEARSRKRQYESQMSSLAPHGRNLRAAPRFSVSNMFLRLCSGQVDPPVASSGTSPWLDCFQALGDKRLYAR